MAPANARLVSASGAATISNPPSTPSMVEGMASQYFSAFSVVTVRNASWVP
eukprot:CAMPEP_0180083096 /NCGR_PEP_ID=MMETSP0985-20121206/19117_1 /TAXON_ID=483367 /ORGANISM="non described non described, Strain CCMP 2436" /LENGTH=50 /DNA_ID=CAMNT_0022016611 /DNA_START=853 /DNA_END=1001 /DNA_ORIENTATION=+